MRIDIFKTSTIRGLFFMLKRKGDIKVDIVKLCEKVLEDEEVKNIPIVYVYAVVYSVINAISSGECFITTEYD